jgi:hypothetical protein
LGDRDRPRLFEHEGRYLDRFGLVLALSAFSISVLSLVDMDDPRESLRSEIGWLIVSFTVGISLLVALRASGVARRWQRVADVVIGLTLASAVVFSVLSRFIGLADRLAIGRPSLIWVLIAVVSPLVVLRRVLSQSVVTFETLFGALSVYLLMAIAFNYIFLEVQRFGSVPFFGVPESSSSFMYFSLVTITTVGYGDLSAVSDVGRFLSTSEAIIGQVFLVTIVARLVSVYSLPSMQPPLDDVPGEQQLE